MERNPKQVGQTSQQPDLTVVEPSLPKGGGAIRSIGETFKPQLFTGSGNYSIPIYASPCRNAEPTVQLTYSSTSGNGPFGMGFSLSLSLISRRTDKGIPRYENTDLFLLDDEQLVAVQTEVIEQDGSVWNITRYRPRVEGAFSFIAFYQNATSSYWKVITREQVTSLYGQSEETRIADPDDPTRVFQWLLEETCDAKGNKTLYQYQDDQPQVASQLSITTSAHTLTRTSNRYLHSIAYGNYYDDQQNEKYAFEIVFDYGEYQLGDTTLAQPNCNPYQTTGQWLTRLDPFSSYRSGFELRTLRLCRNILMFHHMEQELGAEPCLVKITRLVYEESAIFSFMKQVEVIGCRRQADGSYQTKAMPPVLLEYSTFEPSEQTFQPLLVDTAGTISGVPEHGKYHFVDLYGDGLAGCLYSDGATTLYWRPRGNGQFEDPQAPYAFPIERSIDQVTYSLMSLAGNGKLDLVVTTAMRGGFYESHSDGTWDGYQSFTSYPSEATHHERESVDMDGDGLADLLMMEAGSLRYYPSQKKAGYGASVQTGIAQGGEDSFPTATADYAEEVVTFADVMGDGLAHRVRIRNGSVECWPNLGYGRFGERVLLGQAPWYGSELKASRLYLADTNGTGTADLIYVHFDRMEIYLNQSGNGFSEPIVIGLPECYTDQDVISFADVVGNGSSQFILTKTDGVVRHYALDFSGGQKAYLLVSVDDQMGGFTRVSYSTSVAFSLADRLAGREWPTRVPFPVHVVKSIETLDRIAGSREVVRFAYHDGYYDHEEREFKGFGFVEQWDTETFDTYGQVGLTTDGFEVIEPSLYTAPLYTKSWFQTGACSSDGALLAPLARDFYQKDEHIYRMPASLVDAAIDSTDQETLRQACRSLAGTLIREEVYGLDDMEGISEHPYEVKMANFQVRLVQAAGDQPGVFFTHEREQIHFTYERNPDDPRVEHQLALEVDEFAQVLKMCQVYYPRRVGSDVVPEQMTLLATADTHRYIHVTDGFWVNGINCEHEKFELNGLDLAGVTYFTFEQAKAQVEQALANLIGLEQAFTPNTEQSRRLAWERRYFWNDAQDAPLPLGQLTAQVLLHHEEEAIFSSEWITSVFEQRVTADLLQSDGGYILRDGYWWHYKSVQMYFTATDLHFYLPRSLANTYAPADSYLCSKSEYTYDTYSLVPTTTTQYLTDDLANVLVAELDYHVMQPRKITDINGTITEVLFDPLGIVVATTIYGTLDGKEQGDQPLPSYQPRPSSVLEEVLSDPHAYLQQATTFYAYDLFAWINHNQPTWMIGLTRETHVSELSEGETSRLMIAITYSDGQGREVEKKTLADPGPTITGDIAAKRWLVSGRTVYNNKGGVAKQSLPYYSTTATYEQQQDVEKLLPPPTMTHYDALMRVQRVDTPKGFFTKIERTAWEERYYDENDTVKDSAYYQSVMAHVTDELTQEQQDEVDALEKAAVFYGTPEVTIFDTVGHPIRKIQQMVNPAPSTEPLFRNLVTYSQVDILGNVLMTVDPRLYESNRANGTNYANFQYTYDMRGRAFRAVGADAGTRLTLLNINDHPVHSWDARGFHVATSYDRLQRPISVHVDGDDGHGLVLNQTVEQIIYGEHYGSTPSDSQAKNMRGQIYQHYDQAGLIQYDSYGLQGSALQSFRQLRLDYKTEANWDVDHPPTDLLDSETFPTRYTYDALGRVKNETTPDSVTITPRYNQSGLFQSIAMTTAQNTQQPYVLDTQYNANGQVLAISYGNGVTTTYTYEETTHHLMQTRSTGKTILQDISYCYDPVGNITRLRDATYQTVFCNQQIVEPLSDYTYDALYRLIAGTGRQHPGVQGNTYQNGFKQSIFMPFCHPNDTEKLENYRELYTYDDGGNLTSIKHYATSASWTRAMQISPDSNRTTSITLGSGTDTTQTTTYDAGGNLSQLDNLRNLNWNYRNNIARADVIVREDGSSDSSFFVYDHTGQRIRKVTERKISDTITEITEKLYLGNLEWKRVKRVTANLTTTTLDRHSYHIMRGEITVAISHYWAKDDFNQETDHPGERKNRWTLTNHLGSAAIELDHQAKLISYEEYFPYGGTALIAGDSEREVSLKEYRFTGKERDDCTGLYYFGARYYPPWLGRWLNPDPAGEEDGLNLYAFVSGNPLIFTDPDGQGKGKVGGKKNASTSNKKKGTGINRGSKKIAKKNLDEAIQIRAKFSKGSKEDQVQIIAGRRGGRTLRMNKSRFASIAKELQKDFDRSQVTYDQFAAPPTHAQSVPSKVVGAADVKGGLFIGKHVYVEQQQLVSKSSLNVDGRDSTNTTMAKAAQGFNGSNLPASTYSGRDDSNIGGLGEAWCHLIAHCLGGAESADNLVAGSQGSNLVQLGLELAVKDFVSDTGKRLLIRAGANVRVKPNGQLSHIADDFFYNILDPNGKSIYHTKFSATILRADVLQKQKKTEATTALYKYFGLKVPA
ncbi:SpvB/TcaC N-terminal domain-containing protein [Brevibacillus dissolubilis]|uniref:SpvB/TcaC N-terminal domain-containing protein n=1 Tax=Brevibacillus dissolubilis TaxID=1844116 RepID=UPI0011170C07|nr:SpvB/TcaC N-terminal domain-containing protein [Brevibacillus dissolubilis]